MSRTLVFYDLSTLFRKVETSKHIDYPPVAGAVQNISAQLQGGPNPPCCGALNWHCAGLWPASLSKVAASGLSIYTGLPCLSEQIRLAGRRRACFLKPEADCLAYVQSVPSLLDEPGLHLPYAFVASGAAKSQESCSWASIANSLALRCSGLCYAWRSWVAPDPNVWV